MRFRCQQIYSDGTLCKEYSLEGKKYCKWHLISTVLSDATGKWKWVFIVVLYYLSFHLFANIIKSMTKFLSNAHLIELLRTFCFTSFFGLCLSYIMIFYNSSERRKSHSSRFLQCACTFWPKLNLLTIGLLAISSVAFLCTGLALKAFPDTFIWRFQGSDVIPRSYVVIILSHSYNMILRLAYTICALTPKGTPLFAAWWFLPLFALGMNFFAIHPVNAALWILLFIGYWADRRYSWTKRMFRW